MGISEMFSFLTGTTADNSVDAMFGLTISRDDFVNIDVACIYRKILTDMFERTQGLGDDEQAMLWDNCLASENSEGLITMLACAMTLQKELFLVIDTATKVLRVATKDETEQIKADYKAKAESKVGIYISFKNFNVAKMIVLYSGLEFCTVGALNKSMNLAKAIQLKIRDLRPSVSSSDSSIAIAQARSIAAGLSAGKDVLVDAEDVIETAKPDITVAKESLEMLNQKRSFYLGMPASYVTGILNSGLGDTGQADVKAIERGLKIYFYSIGKPVCKALFKKETTFRSEDFQMLEVSLQALQTFDIVSDELMSSENKLKTINKLFGFETDTPGGPKALPEPKKPEPSNLPPPAAVP